MHDDVRAPVGAGDIDDNDDINNNDNYGVVQSGLFGRQAGSPGVQVYWHTGALVFTAGANAGLAFVAPSLPPPAVIVVVHAAMQQSQLKVGTILTMLSIHKIPNNKENYVED